jgi:hypothetical protein
MLIFALRPTKSYVRVFGGKDHITMLTQTQRLRFVRQREAEHHLYPVQQPAFP